MMISGASSSIRRFKRAFLLITRRYKSFTSETANLPPSRLTSGRRSGGRTGKFVIIIHSGRLPEFKKLSTTFSLFTIVFFLASEFVALISSFRVFKSSTKSIFASKSRITSPPILALNPLSSKREAKETYCSSFKTSKTSTFLLFSVS